MKIIILILILAPISLDRTSIEFLYSENLIEGDLLHETQDVFNRGKMVSNFWICGNDKATLKKSCTPIGQDDYGQSLGSRSIDLITNGKTHTFYNRHAEPIHLCQEFIKNMDVALENTNEFCILGELMRSSKEAIKEERLEWIFLKIKTFEKEVDESGYINKHATKSINTVYYNQ